MRPIKNWKMDKRHEPRRMLGVTKMDLMRSEKSARVANWHRKMQVHIASNRHHPFERWLHRWPRWLFGSLPFRDRIGVFHAGY